MSFVGDTSSWEAERQRLHKKHLVEVEKLNKKHNLEIRQLQTILTELRDRLAFTELRLKDTRSELTATQERLEATRRELQQRDQVGPLAQQQLKQLNETVQRLTEERQSMMNQSYLDQSYHEDKYIEKDQVIQAQSLKLQSAAADVRALQDQIDTDALTIHELQQQLEEAHAIRERAERDLAPLREQAEIAEQARRDSAAWRAEAERLKADTARLLRMLAGTEEWADFARMSADSGGITYIGNAQQEAMRWVPEDAYALASAFQRQHMPQVPFSLFAGFMQKLNKIWQHRETKHVARIRG